jgi:hypothetical protein
MPDFTGANILDWAKWHWLKCRLIAPAAWGAAVALAVVKFKRIDAVSTSHAFESDAAVDRLRRVIAHNLFFRRLHEKTVSPPLCLRL